MWVIQFNVLRGGERYPEDGSPREFLGKDSPFPLPDIDQTVLHRGEAFVVDDVIWDLERKTVTVELVPSDEAEAAGKPAAEAVPDDEDIEDDLGADSDEDTDLGADGGEEGDEDLDLRGSELEAPEVPPEEQIPKVQPRRRARGPGPAGKGD